jgi:hypothetical protein
LLVVWPQNHWDSFSWLGLKTGGHGFSQFGLKNGGNGISQFSHKISGDGFPSLDLKTGSYGLVILASKSMRWFLGLGLKTRRATVCGLHHKTEGRMKTVWKQVRLGFPSLSSRMVEAWNRWCTLHHHGGCIELRSKTEGSMQLAASDLTRMSTRGTTLQGLGRPKEESITR